MTPTSLLEKLEKPFLTFVKVSLRTKMILALVSTLIISLGIVSFLSMRIVVTQFNEMAKERIDGAIHAISKELDLKGADALQKLQQTAKITELHSKILVKYEGHIDYQGLGKQLENIKSSTGLDLLELCNKDGVVLGSGHEPGRAGENHSSDPFVQAALKGKSNVSIIEENLLSGNFLAIKVYVPVIYNNEIIGSLSGGYLINQDYLDRIRESSSAHILLLRPDQAPITTFPESSETHRIVINMDAAFLAKALHSKESVYENINLINLPYNVGTHPIIVNEKILGVFVIALSNAGIEHTISDLRRAFLTLALFCTILAVIVAYFLALRITQPIQALVNGAVAIAGGDYKQEIRVTTHDEIAMLVSSFNFMAKELRENQEKLIAAIRLAEWQEVARRIAHEIKNPLTPIALSIQSLQRSYDTKEEDLDEVFKESTQTILEEVDHLRKIVNEFSEFARMPKPKKEWIQITEVLDGTITLYENLQEKVQIHKEYAKSIPTMYGDADQLRRVFSNLIKNAMDAMSKGGDLTIKVFSEIVSGKLFLKIDISDTGDGMTEETRKKLFMPYFSTKEKGTGLGLSIAERIITEHNGTIQVESELGKGTRFILRFPIEVRLSEPA